MTEADPMAPDGADEALAAEYVLGVLEMGERLAAEARLRTDSAFRERVAAWEQRLSSLNVEYESVPAPDLLPAIEARLFPTAPKRRRAWAWFGGAVAAALVAVAVLLPLRGPQGAVLVATLADPAQTLSFAATVDAASGTVTLIRTAGSGAAAGQDLQLWAIGPEGTPAPLGLIREAELTVTARGLAPGVVLAVSLEPEGGSPTGVPTGPVLVTGVLTDR